jgi:hypothetical protein
VSIGVTYLFFWLIFVVPMTIAMLVIDGRRGLREPVYLAMVAAVSLVALGFGTGVIRARPGYDPATKTIHR